MTLVEGKKLRLDFEGKSVAARGTYGRLLAWIFVGDLFVNEGWIGDDGSRFWVK